MQAQNKDTASSADTDSTIEKKKSVVNTDEMDMSTEMSSGATASEAEKALTQFMNDAKNYESRIEKYDADLKEFESLKSKLDEDERKKRQAALNKRDKSIRQQSEALYDFAASHLMNVFSKIKGGVPKRALTQLSKFSVDKCRMPRSTLEDLGTLVEVSTMSSVEQMKTLASAEAAHKEMQRKWEEEKLLRENAERQMQNQQSYMDADSRVASLDPKLSMGTIGVAGSASALRAEKEVKFNYPPGYRNPHVSVEKADDKFDAHGNKTVWVQSKPNKTELPAKAMHQGMVRGVPQPEKPVVDAFGRVHQLTLQNSPDQRHQHLFHMVQDNFSATAAQGRSKMGALPLGLRSQALPEFQGFQAVEGGNFAMIPTNPDGSWANGYAMNEVNRR